MVRHGYLVANPGVSPKLSRGALLFGAPQLSGVSCGAPNSSAPQLSGKVSSGALLFGAPQVTLVSCGAPNSSAPLLTFLNFLNLQLQFQNNTRK